MLGLIAMHIYVRSANHFKELAIVGASDKNHNFVNLLRWQRVTVTVRLFVRSSKNIAKAKAMVFYRDLYDELANVSLSSEIHSVEVLKLLAKKMNKKQRDKKHARSYRSLIWGSYDHSVDMNEASPAMNDQV